MKCSARWWCWRKPVVWMDEGDKSGGRWVCVHHLGLDIP